MTAKQQQESAVPPELAERFKKFNEELIPLLTKYKLGLGAQLEFSPGGVIPKPVFVDVTAQMEEAAKNASAAAEPAGVVEAAV